MDYEELPNDIREPMETCLHQAEQAGALKRYSEQGVKLETTIRNLLVTSYRLGHQLAEDAKREQLKDLADTTKP